MTEYKICCQECIYAPTWDTEMAAQGDAADHARQTGHTVDVEVRDED